MADLFEKWDRAIDTEGLAADVEQAAKDGANRNYEDVDPSDYEVKVQQMDLRASKKGDPMVSIWFKIVSDGKFKGQMIFMNQVVTQGFQVHQANEILRGLVSECDDAPVIEFKTYKQYSQLILDIAEMIDGNFEYALKYGRNAKGYNTFEITDVFVLQ